MQEITEFKFDKTLHFNDMIIIFSAINSLDEKYIFQLYDDINNVFDYTTESYLGCYITNEDYDKLIKGEVDLKSIYLKSMKYTFYDKYYEVYFDQENEIIIYNIKNELTEDDLPGNGIFFTCKK